MNYVLQNVMEASPEGLRDALRGVPLNSRDFRSVLTQT